MHIFIRTGVLKGHIGANKCLCFAKKVLLKLNFERTGDLYDNDFFHCLDICCKRRIFQFLPCGIRMHIHFLARVQNGHING